MDNSEASIHYFGCWQPSHLWRMGNEFNSSQAARKWRVCGVKTIHPQLTPSQNHAFQPDVFPCHYHFLKLNKRNITNATSSSTKTRVYVCSTITISHVDGVETNTRSGITRAPTGVQGRGGDNVPGSMRPRSASSCWWSRPGAAWSPWCLPGAHTRPAQRRQRTQTHHTLCVLVSNDEGRDGGVSQ